MLSRYLPVAAAVPFLLLLIAQPSASAPLTLVPARAALGRCDPSSTRVDCGYYGTTRAPVNQQPRCNTIRNQASTKRNASSAAAAGRQPPLQTHPTLRGALHRASRRPDAPPRPPAPATAPAPMTPVCAMRVMQPAPHRASTIAASGLTVTSKTVAYAATTVPTTRACRARLAKRAPVF
jgi:hypothetical protein